MDRPAGVARLSRLRLLAVALDAAEPSLIDDMMRSGELPEMLALRNQGTWSHVSSPASIGSGAVWPTFLTASEPRVHGIHSEWSWDPESMALQRTSSASLTPFWKESIDAGARIGILDVPFAPHVEAASGFELSEWGAHDRIEGEMRVAPASLRAALPRHPFEEERSDPELVAAQCLEGARMRGELFTRLLSGTPLDAAFIAFTEIHHASHLLWHTASAPAGALRHLMVEVDRQIGAIRAAADPLVVVVFSLHGMRPTNGIPQLLESALVAGRFAHYAGWSSQSWQERAISLFGAMKRRMPPALKKLYYRTVPATATHLLAQPTMLPAYDWQQTRAFSLPSDQHGWIRVNLAGREREGLVPSAGYAALLDELEAFLRALRDREGAALVHDVLRTAASSEKVPQRLPDLVVHWSEAAEQPPYLAVSPRKRVTGQHASAGFAIAQGIALDASLDAASLGRTLAAALR